MTIDIQGGNVTVMVSDMDTAIEFYTNVLGLKMKNRYGNHWADIVGPGISIGLHPTDKNIARGENLQIGLRVPDLEAAVAQLNASDVQCSFNDDDQVRLAFFHDPDGNVLYLVQPEW